MTFSESFNHFKLAGLGRRGEQRSMARPPMAPEGISMDWWLMVVGDGDVQARLGSLSSLGSFGAMIERFWFTERERDGNAFMIIFGEILNEHTTLLGLVPEKVLKLFGKTRQGEKK